MGELRRARDRFDAVLYHLGNDVSAHREIAGACLEVPGVIMLHEVMLHHLVRGMTMSGGDHRAYREALRSVFGEVGSKVVGRLLEAPESRELWRYPLFEPFVDRSLGVIVHNEWARDRVRRSRPDAPVEVVPHHLCLDALPDEDEPRTAVRRRLDLPQDAFVVGSFGFMTRSKRIESALAAFQALRGRHPDAVYVIAGDLAPNKQLAGLLEGRLGEGVRALGRVDDAQFLSLMRAVDVAVNLRHPSGGETSGSLIRLLGMGVPCVVSDAGPFGALPEGTVIKVPTDYREHRYLAAALLTLADEPGLRHELGRAAAEHVRKRHALPVSAAAYAAGIERILERPYRPVPQVPPLRPFEEGDVGARVAGWVGAALHDLGVSRDDVEAREMVAGIVGELGLG